MVIFVWLVAQHPMRGELKCAKMMNGVQSVMMDGATLMPEWSADNWGLNHKVQGHTTELIMVKELELYT